MIVLPKIKTLIVTPPHTASGNLHRSFCPPAIFVEGPNPDGLMDHHFCQIDKYSDYRKILVVRHPYTRFVGLYHHYLLFCKSANIPPIDFNLYTEMVLEDHPNLSWMYKYTITDLIDFYLKTGYSAREIAKIFEILRFENLPILPEGLPSVKIDAGWTDYPYYGNEDRVNQWGKKDLEFYAE